jgi:hypothetical protein
MSGLGSSGKTRPSPSALELQSAAAFRHRKNHRDLRSRLPASHVYPIASSDYDRMHGVLRRIIAELPLGIFPGRSAEGLLLESEVSQ